LTPAATTAAETPSATTTTTSTATATAAAGSKCEVHNNQASCHEKCNEND
jgi:hypothetical protein